MVLNPASPSDQLVIYIDLDDPSRNGSKPCQSFGLSLDKPDELKDYVAMVLNPASPSDQWGNC